MKKIIVIELDTTGLIGVDRFVAAAGNAIADHCVKNFCQKCTHYVDCQLVEGGIREEAYRHTDSESYRNFDGKTKKQPAVSAVFSCEKFSLKRGVPNREQKAKSKG